jgi:hypothetical protein
VQDDSGTTRNTQQYHATEYSTMYHNTELMEANWEYCREYIQSQATKMKIIDKTHPESSCRGAMQLDNFLNTI